MNRNEEINLYTVAAVRDFAETIQVLLNRPPVLDAHAVGRAKDHLGCLAAHMETAIDLAGKPEEETPHRRMEVTLPNGTVAAITADPDMSPETMHALTEMMRIVSEQAAAGTLHSPENDRVVAPAVGSSNSNWNVIAGCHSRIVRLLHFLIRR